MKQLILSPLNHRPATMTAVCLFVHIPGNHRAGTKDNVLLEVLAEIL
jgi:hypothetical protein